MLVYGGWSRVLVCQHPLLPHKLMVGAGERGCAGTPVLQSHLLAGSLYCREFLQAQITGVICPYGTLSHHTRSGSNGTSLCLLTPAGPSKAP